MADPFKYPRDPLVRSMERNRHQREVDEQKEIVVRMRKLNSKVIAERDKFQAAMQIAISLAYRASRDLYRGPPRNPDYDREADITAQIDKMCREYPMTPVDGGAEHG